MSTPFKPEISVITPVYKCAECLTEFINRTIEAVSSITQEYEIILVNDGSPDNSWEIICEFASRNPRIRGIALSRNFGQHPAVFCGLHNCTGNVVVITNCDLQEAPEYIPSLYLKYKEGYDVVFTLRDVRRFGLIRNFITSIYYKVYSYLTDDQFMLMNKSYGALTLISNKVVSHLLMLKDAQFQYVPLIKWIGFRSTYVEIKHDARKCGKSSYTVKKLVELALSSILFHSYKLLRLNIIIGIIISILSFLGIFIILITYFVKGYAQGWTSIVVLILFSIGSIFWSTGLLGMYIEKIFDQVKQRPIYIVDKTVNI